METKEPVERKQARQRRAGDKRPRYRIEEPLAVVRMVTQEGFATILGCAVAMALLGFESLFGLASVRMVFVTRQEEARGGRARVAPVDSWDGFTGFIGFDLRGDLHETGVGRAPGGRSWS